MIYDVDPVEDDALKLREVLEVVAAREGHVRIVNVIWKSARDDTAAGGGRLVPGYVIISERKI